MNNFKYSFLILCFLLVEIPLAFAVPTIAGVYSGNLEESHVCPKDGNFPESYVISVLSISQSGSSFNTTWSTTNTDSEGEVLHYSIHFTGTIDNNGNITGTYTTNEEVTDDPNPLNIGETVVGNGSFSGTSDGTGLLINGAGSETQYSSDGTFDEACTLNFTFTLSKPIIAETHTAEVQSTTGTSLSISPIDADVLTTSSTISDIGALLTLDNSTVTIQRDDGSTLEIKQNAVVTLNPESSINLIRGEITTSVDCNAEVRTALATITSCPTTKKGADTAKFTTSYSQIGLDGTIKVSVETGNVDITDREGNTYILNAGEEKIIQKRVPRTSWVLPIDGDKLYGGETNFLIWTQFPDAASYQMEFNLPSPYFSEQNVSVPQFTKQVVPLPAGSYAEFEGLALLTLPLPKGADGLVLELRIFALDAANNIIGESVSSDSTKSTVTD